ncbi:MAG: aspartate kinase [Ruminococcaceae bacterium]|nr:aspartate kinase [Oscillospiraceae bacterium]
MLKTVKFGGSSLADAERFQNIKKIIDLDPSRKVMVVSAPGKSKAYRNKITDLLYLCNEHIKYKVDYSEFFAMIEGRYRDIAATLGIADKLDLDAEFAEIHRGIEEKKGTNYLVSRGEYLCAKLMAAYLGYDFVDAADVIIFDYRGNIDFNKTNSALVNAYRASCGRIVIPGFYGSLPGGAIQLMTRGGSDVTGAIAAAALDCDMYENWTDVAGILMADPEIVKNPLPISHITYSQLRDMTYMGAKVLHEETVLAVREKNIPINIRSTLDIHNPGTVISSESEAAKNGRVITGLTGRKGFTIISVAKNHVSAEIGVIRQVVETCEKLDVQIENMLFGIDCFSMVLRNDQVAANMYNLVAALEQICGENSVKIRENISLVAAVGCRAEGGRAAVYSKMLETLAANEIRIRIITQGPEEANLVIGVDDKHCDDAIRVLYQAFVG